MSFDKLHEECAVYGVSLNVDEAAGITYNGLLALQHRGQESAGIAVYDTDRLVCRKNLGLVSEAITNEMLTDLAHSKSAIGHCLYSGKGNSHECDVQPFVTEYLTGRIATAHNGNLVNGRGIKKRLIKLGVRFTSNSDSEIISALVAYNTVVAGSLEDGVAKAMNELIGAFSVVILSGDNSIVAFRDPWGYRPLCIGENSNGIAVASESCGLDSQGFNFIRDIAPGEMVIIRDGKIVTEKIVLTKEKRGLCIFEYVYFARTDSFIEGMSVFKSRFNMGKILAEECPADADIVCGVPDSGLEAAQGYAAQSGLPLVPAFVKNRYIGRSFIYPTQSQRETAVKIKLNPLRVNVEGKRIVLVDDSIVRGTTSANIISALKSAGAKEVHMRISSPPFKHNCYFGTDVDNEENLAANRMTIQGICDSIGAESLGYLSIDGLKRACDECQLPFCTGCFDGEYFIDDEILREYREGK
ncbi:MAG: amidophosphoribosyltransferase [Clostridiales bacterium]|nr:amidophosphoribosyltransferase [Clostridiales bacterium]